MKNRDLGLLPNLVALVALSSSSSSYTSSRVAVAREVGLGLFYPSSSLSSLPIAALLPFILLYLGARYIYLDRDVVKID